MRVMAKGSLRRSRERPGCADARGPLHSGYAEAVKAPWRRPRDISHHSPSASIRGNNWVVFKVGGHRCRGMVDVPHQPGIVWVKFVGDHTRSSAASAWRT